MLSKNDKQYLFKKLPKIELFYEDILHKKVPANYYILIPNGKLTYIWFTQLYNKNIALQLFINQNGNIIDMKPLILSYTNNICTNTIIYGINLNLNKTNFFIIKDIIYYKNINYSDITFDNKLKLYNNFFKNISNTPISSIQIHLPVIDYNYHNIIDIINILPYKIKYIEFYKDNLIGKYFIKNSLRANFLIKANYKEDIYDLYCLNKYNELEKYDIAYIPSYKKSVEMNNLFRNIRENNNLDLLEESDDEDTFENISYDKFLNSVKEFVMDCIYVPKFKKWLPQTIVNDHNLSNIITYDKLKYIS